MPSHPHTSAWAALQARGDAARPDSRSATRPRPEADGPRRRPRRRTDATPQQHPLAFPQQEAPAATPASTQVDTAESKDRPGLLRAWSNNGAVRVAVGVVATVALIFSIQRTVDTPEEITQAPQLSAHAGEAPAIAPSPAQEMYVPAVGIHANFDAEPCRVKDGAIDPENMDTACTYTADNRPYSLPGPTAEDLVVVAGHTGAGVPGVFDNLYDGGSDEHRINVGDKLYLRTAASGDDWLVYTATDLHDPNKGGLADDASVWGDGPQPGRLLTISCIQPANLWQPAVRNAVVGWQLESVVSPDAGSDAPDQVSPDEVQPVPYPGKEPATL
ncbi:hypothetical protein VVR85_10230 [Corynebacterium sp. LK2590]|uniref:hypothetical protein n=1 Tax=unclassified Corynebacterium TaxID=2624378 RepID=UPI0034CF6E8B